MSTSTTPRDELASANIDAALSPKAARLALGGISPATEFRWTRQGILRPFYIGTTKRYRANDIREIVKGGAK